MSEIEKMYENAGIKPDCTYLFLVDGNGENEAARTISIGSKADLKRWIVDCGVKGKVIKSTNTLKPFYPPFTAEKQISLIIFLSYKYGKGLLINLRTMDKDIDIYDFELFGECLAKLVNELWQDLTEEEKQQVKEILQ